MAPTGMKVGQLAVRLIVLLLKTAHTLESPDVANQGVNCPIPVSLLACRKKTTRSAYSKNLPLKPGVTFNRC